MIMTLPGLLWLPVPKDGRRAESKGFWALDAEPGAEAASSPG